jgi:hypothetical protein
MVRAIRERLSPRRIDRSLMLAAPQRAGALEELMNRIASAAFDGSDCRGVSRAWQQNGRRLTPNNVPYPAGRACPPRPARFYS